MKQHQIEFREVVIDKLNKIEERQQKMNTTMSVITNKNEAVSSNIQKYCEKINSYEEALLIFVLLLLYKQFPQNVQILLMRISVK